MDMVALTAINHRLSLPVWWTLQLLLSSSLLLLLMLALEGMVCHMAMVMLVSMGTLAMLLMLAMLLIQHCLAMLTQGHTGDTLAGHMLLLPQLLHRRRTE